MDESSLDGMSDLNSFPPIHLILYGLKIMLPLNTHEIPRNIRAIDFKSMEPAFHESECVVRIVVVDFRILVARLLDELQER